MDVYRQKIGQIVGTICRLRRILIQLMEVLLVQACLESLASVLVQELELEELAQVQLGSEGRHQ